MPRPVLLDANVVIKACDSRRKYHEESKAIMGYLDNPNWNPLITERTVADAANSSYFRERAGEHEKSEFTKILSSLNIIEMPLTPMLKYLKEVAVMYNDIQMEFENYVWDRMKWAARKKKRAKRMVKVFNKDPSYRRLRYKIYEDSVSISDMRILAEAAALKDRYDEVYLVSSDYHFVRLRKGSDKFLNSLFPNTIYNTFGVKCEWPDLLYKAFVEEDRQLSMDIGEEASKATGSKFVKVAVKESENVSWRQKKL